MKVYSNGIYLPWQLLHSPQSRGEAPDETQFWGNKYILGVIPIGPDREHCGRLPGLMTLDEKNPILYAHYWQPLGHASGATSEADNPAPKVEVDSVSRLGEMFGEIVRKTLGNEVQVVRSKPEFKDRLTGDLRNLAVLWTFTHGHSGDIVVQTQGKSIIAKEPGGQRLSFSENDSISALEIKIATVDKASGPFFGSRPFVFLNGCETGTQGARGTTDFSLPGVFLMRGARGVIATEAPVWDFFGYNFGALFLEKLAAGNDAGEAMLATRLEFVKQSRNPLGLLYTYYGNPAVRIKKPGT
jgi:hypothetical protein